MSIESKSPISDKIVADLLAAKTPEAVLPNVSVHDLGFIKSLSAYAGQQYSSPSEHSMYDGGKFAGGFGATQVQQLDYWTLRARSAQLFNENLYARGLIRRLITNEINTGLTPECCPDEKILGVEEDSLNDWTEDVENRFGLWHKNPLLCDHKQVDTFGGIQRNQRLEALIEGDVLCVLRQSPRTKLPTVQTVPGSKIRTPLGESMTKLRKGHKIIQGVELDTMGRHVAFWVTQDGGGSKRLPAYGEKSGRKLAWLVYGTEKRSSEVRGVPLLSLVLQSLKEIDRYRDSVQRKAVINAMIAMFIKKTEDKPGTLPITGGAIRKDTATVTDGDGARRDFSIASQMQGMVLEELQTGEEPVGFHNQGTDEAFGVFEKAIIQAVAWGNEMPPEILTLAFGSNYSASQAAINEFKMYLNKIWSEQGENFCTPIFTDWLISSVLLGKISAPGLLQSWRDPSKYDIYGAWVAVDWYGSIKPSTDMLKQTKGSKNLVDNGWSTNAKEARGNTGTKFSKNIRRLKRENQQLVDARRPLAEFNKEFGINSNEDSALTALSDAADNIIEFSENIGEG